MIPFLSNLADLDLDPIEKNLNVSRRFVADIVRIYLLLSSNSKEGSIGDGCAKKRV